MKKQLCLLAATFCLLLAATTAAPLPQDNFMRSINNKSVLTITSAGLAATALATFFSDPEVRKSLKEGKFWQLMKSRGFSRKNIRPLLAAMAATAAIGTGIGAYYVDSPAVQAEKQRALVETEMIRRGKTVLTQEFLKSYSSDDKQILVPAEMRTLLSRALSTAERSALDEKSTELETAQERYQHNKSTKNTKALAIAGKEYRDLLISAATKAASAAQEAAQAATGTDTKEYDYAPKYDASGFVVFDDQSSKVVFSKTKKITEREYYERLAQDFERLADTKGPNSEKLENAAAAIIQRGWRNRYKFSNVDLKTEAGATIRAKETAALMKKLGFVEIVKNHGEHNNKVEGKKRDLKSKLDLLARDFHSFSKAELKTRADELKARHAEVAKLKKEISELEPAGTYKRLENLMNYLEKLEGKYPLYKKALKGMVETDPYFDPLKQKSKEEFDVEY